MKNRIMNLLLAITFIFITLFSQSCIQGGDKRYFEWKPTDAEKKEIMEKMLEQHEKELQKQQK